MATTAARIQDVIYFRDYRGEPALSETEIKKFYRKEIWEGYELPDLPAPAYKPFPGPPKDPSPPDQFPYDDDIRKFLDSKFPDLEEGWKGTKYLGAGIAHLAVFKNAALGRSLVVKDTALQPIQDDHEPEVLDMSEEARMHKILSVKSSEHIIRIEAPPVTINAAAKGLGAEWDGITTRLYLEYGPLGSTQQILDMRRQIQQVFSEASLWLIFHCLIDGCTAMEYAGGEFIVSKKRKKKGSVVSPITKKQRKKWTPVVHFDIKPDNIFVGEKNDPGHTDHPIFKFGDFGVSKKIKRNQSGKAFATEMQKFSKSGTWGYYTPEQFTAGWDYKGYEKDQTVGNFDWRTNVWGIGSIMWRLAVLAGKRDLDPKKPFLPDRHLNGAPPKGNTYGKDLDAPEYAYSKRLKDTIFECLYENRTFRPELNKLKGIAHKGYEAAVALAPVDPYEKFLVEPRDTTLKLCTCRAVLRRGPRKGAACERKAMPSMQEQRAIDALTPRCEKHPCIDYPVGI